MDQTNSNPDLNDFISLSEAATIIGLSTRHLRHLAETGGLWARKLGRNWLTTKQAINEYSNRERKPGPKPK